MNEISIFNSYPDYEFSRTQYVRWGTGTRIDTAEILRIMKWDIAHKLWEQVAQRLYK